MKRIKLLLLSSLLFASCGIEKNIVTEKYTGLSLSQYEAVFPPDAIHIRKEKEYWFSFDRNGKKYLLYYPGSFDCIQIMDY